VNLHYDTENSLNVPDEALEDIICLVAVIYSLFDSDIESFLGLPSHNGRGLKLSPSASLDETIVEGLVERNALRLAENTSCDGNSQYREGTLQLAIPEGVSDASDYLSSLESSLSASKPSMKNAAVVKLCEEIAIHECLAFFDYAMNYHHIYFKVGKRTRSIIVRGLKSYSVGQICSLIWSVVKGCVTARKIRKKSYHHMIKYADLALGRMIDRAIVEPWSVQQFKRVTPLPQSQLSYVIFSMILKTKDDGYGFSLVCPDHSIRQEIQVMEQIQPYDPLENIKDRDDLYIFLQDTLATGNASYISTVTSRLVPIVENVTGAKINPGNDCRGSLKLFLELVKLMDCKLEVSKQ
jgi:hypothetical protein